MFANYLKTALRNFRANKLYTLISVTGLAAGMMCALFILVFARHEVSFDRFHQDVDSVYQVLNTSDEKNSPATATPLAPLLKEQIPELVATSRYHWFWGETILQCGRESYYESGIRLVDPEFFDIFSFPFIKGDPKTALIDRNSLVMTQESAEKYFGNENPLGKTLTLNHQDVLTVTGVISNVPDNSSLEFDMLMPIEFNIASKGDWYTAWNNLFVYSFFKCRAGTSPALLKEKIQRALGNLVGVAVTKVEVLPFKDRHFLFQSDRTTVIVLLSVAAFILLIAAVNFVNLSTALSLRRTKEIGMRTVLGAARRQIILQHLGESVLQAIVAAALAVLLFYQLLPVFRAITGNDIGISASFVLSCTIGVGLLTGVLAGVYPALFASSLGSERALKEKLGASVKGGTMRRSMVVVQFALSLLVALGATIVYKQVRYMQAKDLGYQKEDVVCIRMGGGSEKHYQTFRDELLRQPGITSVSGMALPLPFFGWRINAFSWEGKDPNEGRPISYNEIDYDFLKTLDIRLIGGRDASREYPADEGSGVLINQKMAALMNVDPVIGATIMQGDVALRVVGVVDDFHFTSMRNEIEPLILMLYPPDIDNVLIRISPLDRSAALAQIESTWNRTFPGFPFQYSYLSDDFERSLTSMKRTEYLLTVFAAMAVLMSCLGLFGLSSLLAEQRVKEIGIRKALGASAVDIVKQFSLQFVPLVLIANVVVWPTAYFLMDRWLSGFAYRTHIGYSVFLITAIASVAVASLSVAYKALKAASANPIDSLRSDG